MGQDRCTGSGVDYGKSRQGVFDNARPARPFAARSEDDPVGMDGDLETVAGADTEALTRGLREDDLAFRGNRRLHGKTILPRRRVAAGWKLPGIEETSPVSRRRLFG